MNIVSPNPCNDSIELAQVVFIHVFFPYDSYIIAHQRKCRQNFIACTFNVSDLLSVCFNRIKNNLNAVFVEIIDVGDMIVMYVPQRSECSSFGRSRNHNEWIILLTSYRIGELITNGPAEGKWLTV